MIEIAALIQYIHATPTKGWSFLCPCGHQSLGDQAQRENSSRRVKDSTELAILQMKSFKLGGKSPFPRKGVPPKG
ncbi:MAG: hypothetical protein LBJ18_04690, partial [Rickettsiales bacterium]|nr:hypothetical protein [Rickettsiales bacterium]